MKAIVQLKYGSSDVLQLIDLPIPTPKDDQVLIKVHAASINAADWEIQRGTPFYNRLFGGMFKPSNQLCGSDIAGVVEAVGKEVQGFQPGDEVIADSFWGGMGAFAEYAVVREKVTTHKPKQMTFEEAATYPQAGLLALQGLRDGKPVQPGQKVLINGAGGGTGTFAVQLAKSFGAEVTAVDRASKLEMLKRLGADRVRDFREVNYTKTGPYDRILDVVAHRSIFAYRRALAPTGKFVMVGGTPFTLLQVGLLGQLRSRHNQKDIGLLIWKQNVEDLQELLKLYEKGQVIPVIDRTYPLQDAAEAMRYFGTGKAHGKIVITIT